MEPQKEKVSLNLLDSVPPTPSPAISSSAMTPTTSMEIASPSIVPESLSSTPLLKNSSTPSSSLGHILTSNNSFYDVPMTDAFSDLLDRFVPPDQKPVRPTTQQIQQGLDDDSKPDVLVTMVMNNHWRGIARYARQKLVQTSSTDLETIFQLWYIRLLALYQLGLYQLASAEFEKMGDFQQLQFHHCMPFEMRVLWAILPAKLQHHLITLERLTLLAIQCQKNSQDQHREIQVYIILVTQFIQINDYHSASKLLSTVLDKVSSSSSYDDGVKIDLLSSLGRLYLQLGDLDSAEKLYTQIEALQDTLKEKQHVFQEIIKMNRAYLFIGRGEWQNAKEILEQVIQQNNENLVAVNNLAVCHIYLGDLPGALPLLDKMIQQNPTSAGTCEVTLMNLCTLYDLRYEASNHFKIQLMKQIARWVGDSFHPSCLKLQ
ncbi:unnamed protein product [Cunninghamella blakesleeana]